MKLTLEEAKNIVHKVIRGAHMEDKLPKWTPRIELAHQMVREDEELKKAIAQENQKMEKAAENHQA